MKTKTCPKCQQTMEYMPALPPGKWSPLGWKPYWACICGHTEDAGKEEGNTDG